MQQITNYFYGHFLKLCNKLQTISMAIFYSYVKLPTISMAILYSYV